MSAERPRITQTHGDFHRLAGQLGGSMTDTLLEASENYLGIPPNEQHANYLRGSYANYILFDSSDMPKHSRYIPGSVAGSDAISLKEVSLTHEADGGSMDEVSYQQRYFPGRLITFVLHYGTPPAYSTGYTLLAGHEAPPLIFDQAMYTQWIYRPGGEKYADLSANVVGGLVDALPENKIHYPDQSELQVILGAMESAKQDMSPREAFTWLLHDIRCHALNDDPKAQAEIAWVRARLLHLESVASTVGTLAQRPFKAAAAS